MAKVASSKKTKKDIRHSKANYEFDIFEDIWRLDANTKINFGLLKALNLDSKFEESFRLVLADYACEFSAHYTNNLYRFCRWLFEFDVTDTVQESHILNYKASLDDETEYKLGYIRAFLLDWNYKGYKGVDKKAIELLSKLTIKGNVKGKAVAVGCPYSGAYSYDEQVDFINWYVNAYTNGEITLTDYALLMALQYTGTRSIQIAHLYHQDIVKKVVNGIEAFNLNMPNAKKRNQGFRDSFRANEAIDDDLVLVLSEQAKLSIKLVESHFNVSLNDKQKHMIPIFLNVKELKELRNYDQFLAVQKATPDLLCISMNALNNRLRVIAALCPLKTKRIMLDNEFGDLHINPRRFRYTHATNLAMQGASAFVIAHELGHEDIQNVGVYTEFNETVAEQIDDALAPALIPLAQAFAGTLIDSEKDAIRANDPRSLTRTNDGLPVGNCGQFGFCVDGIINCYTCNKFQPWVNAPHEKFLEQVISLREHRRSLGTEESLLQNFNNTIDAIRVVVSMCEKRKQELAKEGAINV